MMIMELPLAVLCHVRPVSPCDVIHERTEDIPRIFQIIYDRSLLEIYQAGLGFLPRLLSPGTPSASYGGCFVPFYMIIRIPGICILCTVLILLLVVQVCNSS